MKKILLVLTLLGICVSAHATDLGVIESSVTIYQVSISSYAASTATATTVLYSTQTMKNATHFEIQNLDVTYDAFCAFQIITSTIGANVFKIPKSGDIVKFDMRPFPLYCLTENDGTSQISILQGY